MLFHTEFKIAHQSGKEINMSETKRPLSILIVILAILMLIPFLNSPKSLNTSNAKSGAFQSKTVGIDLPYHPGAQNAAVSGSNAIVPSSGDSLLEADAFGIAYTLSDKISISDYERRLIAATVQLEVLGKYSTADQFARPDLKYFEMLAVAQIIKNRLKNDRFPSDIETIICASATTANGTVYQFSTSPYLSTTNPSALAYTAVDEVFEKGINVLPDDYLFFCATWHESAFEVSNRQILKFIGSAGTYDKIVADATTFYASVTIQENINNGYVF